MVEQCSRLWQNIAFFKLLLVLSSYTIEEDEVVQKNGSSYTKTIEVPRVECTNVPRQVARQQGHEIPREELSPYQPQHYGSPQADIDTPGQGKNIKNYQLIVLRECVFRFAVTFYTGTIQVLCQQRGGQMLMFADKVGGWKWPNADVSKKL